MSGNMINSLTSYTVFDENGNYECLEEPYIFPQKDHELRQHGYDVAIFRELHEYVYTGECQVADCVLGHEDEMKTRADAEEAIRVKALKDEAVLKREREARARPAPKVSSQWEDVKEYLGSRRRSTPKRKPNTVAASRSTTPRRAQKARNVVTHDSPKKSPKKSARKKTSPNSTLASTTKQPHSHVSVEAEVSDAGSQAIKSPVILVNEGTKRELGNGTGTVDSHPSHLAEVSDTGSQAIESSVILVDEGTKKELGNGTGTVDSHPSHLAEVSDTGSQAIESSVILVDEGTKKELGNGTGTVDSHPSHLAEVSDTGSQAIESSVILVDEGTKKELGDGTGTVDSHPSHSAEDATAATVIDAAHKGAYFPIVTKEAKEKLSGHASRVEEETTLAPFNTEQSTESCNAVNPQGDISQTHSATLKRKRSESESESTAEKRLKQGHSAPQVAPSQVVDGPCNIDTTHYMRPRNDTPSDASFHTVDDADTTHEQTEPRGWIRGFLVTMRGMLMPRH
ncbi:hypothetical protein BC567DRAFT_298802 [Phyllosticta citribraziliensis]